MIRRCAQAPVLERQKGLLWPFAAHPDAFERLGSLWRDISTRNANDAQIVANASAFFAVAKSKDAAIEFMERARDLAPRVQRYRAELARLYQLASRSADDGDRARRLAVEALAEYEAALALSDEADRFSVLHGAAYAGLRAHQDDRAEWFARELLGAASRHEGTWRYDDAVHHGNTVLGMVALRRGDVRAATDRLIASAQVGRDGSRGPLTLSLDLAGALLRANERDAVMQYLALCKKFSSDPRLDQWIDDLKQGHVPNTRL
jgi:hypothetical protein